MNGLWFPVAMALQGLDYLPGSSSAHSPDDFHDDPLSIGNTRYLPRALVFGRGAHAEILQV